VSEPATRADVVGRDGIEPPALRLSAGCDSSGSVGPDASPVLLNDPAYVGVAVTSLPGRPGFQRIRTLLVGRHQVAAIICATAGLRADPAALLAEQAPGLRVVPDPAPGDAV
jgi:hypothetical protein